MICISVPNFSLVYPKSELPNLALSAFQSSPKIKLLFATTTRPLTTLVSLRSSHISLSSLSTRFCTFPVPRDARHRVPSRVAAVAVPGPQDCSPVQFYYIRDCCEGQTNSIKYYVKSVARSLKGHFISWASHCWCCSRRRQCSPSGRWTDWSSYLLCGM